jgi:hypothetical protein
VSAIWLADEHIVVAYSQLLAPAAVGEAIRVRHWTEAQAAARQRGGYISEFRWGKRACPEKCVLGPDHAHFAWAATVDL